MAGDKMPMSWHEECLKNQRGTRDRLLETINRLQRDLAEQNKSIEFYELQISTAKKKKKNGFDRGRFMSSQRPNGIIL